MAMVRLNVPSVFIYGGSILPKYKGKDVTDVFEAVGKHALELSDQDLKDIEQLLAHLLDRVEVSLTNTMACILKQLV